MTMLKEFLEILLKSFPSLFPLIKTALQEMRSRGGIDSAGYEVLLKHVRPARFSQIDADIDADIDRLKLPHGGKNNANE